MTKESFNNVANPQIFVSRLVLQIMAGCFAIKVMDPIIIRAAIKDFAPAWISVESVARP